MASGWASPGVAREMAASREVACWGRAAGVEVPAALAVAAAQEAEPRAVATEVVAAVRGAEPVEVARVAMLDEEGVAAVPGARAAPEAVVPGAAARQK